ncbi:hypothetical protein [Bradyrhizobium canariense]|uniref:hypothetical protein n=1 Tax=Bradyrhizobium canariense TaxID=255045 RepID=UPI001FEBDAA9|nr:hypothetical protein [Bradyrhizobium canariense]
MFPILMDLRAGALMHVKPSADCEIASYCEPEMLRYDHSTGAGCIFHLVVIFDRAGRSSSPPAAAFVFTAVSTNEFGVLCHGEDIVSKENNCLIVRAAGRQLDLLRGEASRIAKGSNADWWIDQAEVGTRFCFEDTKAKESFALACDNLGIPCQDG